MNFDDNTYEKIGLYIDNQMNDAERTAFEELLEKDTELAAFVDTLTSLESVYNEHTWNVKANASVTEIKALANEFRADDVVALSQKIRNIQQQKSSIPKKRNKSYFYVISSAVAIAAVMTLLYFSFMQSITASDAFEQYHNWNTLPSFVEKGTTDDNRVKAQALFQDGNYQEALSIFMETTKDATYDPKTQLYIGVCYLELENYREAIQTFDKLRNSNTLDNHKAYWYTALVYLKQNNAETAKKVLQTLVQDTSNYNYEKAVELLKKLE